MFTIEVDESGYQLVADSGEESGVTDYGDTAEVEVEEATAVVVTTAAVGVLVPALRLALP